MGDKKKKYRDVNGTTRIGDFLRTLSGVAPEILKLASTVLPDAGILGVLADKINKTDTISQFDKDYALKQLEMDIEESKEITKRWEADMNSDSWLSKNVRPLVVANFTILIDIVVIGSMAGSSLGEAYLPLLMTMGITAIGGYFTLREYGKANKNK